jgi:hypothetical protein
MLLEGYTHPECSTYLRVKIAEVMATSQLEPPTYKSCDSQRLLSAGWSRKQMARFQAMRLVTFSPCTAYLVRYLLENGKNDWQLEIGRVPAEGQ